MAKVRPDYNNEDKNSLSSIQFVDYAELNIGESVGSGGFGKVFKGKWQNNIIAIKQLFLESISMELQKELVKEASIMHKCHHPCIVQFFGISLHEDKNFLIMEYLSKGSLYKVLSDSKIELQWNTRINIACDIASGLKYLHSQFIIHRDLKSMNILLDDNFKAKISDFGLAKIKVVTTSTITNVNRPGSVRWNAPELFQFSQAKETYKSDIWSAGMVFWEIASRKLPFDEIKDDMRVMFFIAKGQKQEIPKDSPKILSDVILECWDLDQSKRPSADLISSKLVAYVQNQNSNSNSNTSVPTQEKTKGSANQYSHSSINLITDLGEATPIVIDNGSSFFYSGFGGDDAPRSLIHSVTGFPIKSNTKLENRRYIGNDAMINLGLLSLQSVMERGIVKNWDDLESVYHEIFTKELCVPPEEHPVMLTDIYFSPKAQREKMVQLLFETFNVPGCYIAKQGYLALLASGRTTGLVVDCGEGMTTVVPIEDNIVIDPFAVQRLKLAGRDITDFLMKQLLPEKGYIFSTNQEREIVRYMKEQLADVALDSNFEMLSPSPMSYELPDGQIITLDIERFKCSEVLFQPHLMGIDSEGIHEAIFKAVDKIADVDSRKQLYGNIVLTGGTTLLGHKSLDGFPARIKKEVEALAPSVTRVKVIAVPERRYMNWIGGSILPSLSSFQEMWISKKEYDEFGPSVANKK